MYPDLPVSLYRAAAVRELDRGAIACGIPGYTLMTRAGEAAFKVLKRHWPQASRIAVVCGGGNNAGDGYVVARLAHQQGLPVTAWTLSDPRLLRGDAATAFQEAQQAGVSVRWFNADELQDASVIVDALVGTGLNGTVSDELRQAIEAINDHPAPVLALDIPSGLHADTGRVLGAAIYAHVTVTFIALKQGLMTGQGRGHSGHLEFAGLDVPEEIYRTVTPSSHRYTGQDLPNLLPPRRRTAHKRDYGHVLVVGGDHGMSGAVRMAAEAAGRSGAGLVSVATRPEHAAWHTVARPEVMFHGVHHLTDLEPLIRRATVVAVGPGLGRSEWSHDCMATVLSSGHRLVVDADGLNLLSEQPRRHADWILTPHPGEAARLLETTVDDIEADRFSAVQAIVERFGGIAVLKGAGTLISDGAGVWVCDGGNPGMASGGMGDVLTGVIAGLLAQGLTPLDAARAGTYIHAIAGDEAARAGGERGLLATDLLPFIRQFVNPYCR